MQLPCVVKGALPTLTFLVQFLLAAEPAGDIKKMVFEEQRIEGKIRRPQLVLIKAEQRPEFHPMILQSFGKQENMVSSINEQLIEDSPYNEPFQFNGTSISNYQP